MSSFKKFIDDKCDFSNKNMGESNHDLIYINIFSGKKTKL